MPLSVLTISGDNFRRSASCNQRTRKRCSDVATILHERPNALRNTFVLIALVATCVSSTVSAKKEEPYRPSPPTIIASPFAMAVGAFDRDGDYKVSRAEFDWGVSRAFAAFDRDGDGSLSLIEFAAWAEAVLGNSGALPGQFDFDRDGNDKISRDEFRDYFAGRFAALDKNRDGSLSRAELVSFAPSPMRDRDDRRERDDGRRTSPGSRR